MSNSASPLKVTDEHLRQAFALCAWRGWTFEAAMSDVVRSKVIRARAASLARTELKRTHQRERVLVRRVDPKTGRWVTTTHAGPHTVPSILPDEE